MQHPKMVGMLFQTFHFSIKMKLGLQKDMFYDMISGEYSIYFKGQISESTKDECIGLEEASVWENELIVDRIMGEDKWTEILK